MISDLNDFLFELSGFYFALVKEAGRWGFGCSPDSMIFNLDLVVFLWLLFCLVVDVGSLWCRSLYIRPQRFAFYYSFWILLCFFWVFVFLLDIGMSFVLVETNFWVLSLLVCAFSLSKFGFDLAEAFSRFSFFGLAL